MIMEKYLISVVIPVYNNPDMLRETLRSVIKQTYQNIEIHVVDDGSEEDIESVVNEVSDNRIKYYKLEHKNADTARNYGIIQSQGDYIAMLDSDDIWLENHLVQCLSLLQEKNADGIYGSLIISKKFTTQKKTIYVRNPREHETMIDYLLFVGYGAQSSTLFMTAESAKDILWDESLTNNDDYDFVVRYCKKYKMESKYEPTVIYNSKPRNQCDFQSCIRFIDRFREEIRSDVYYLYHKNMLRLAKRINATPDVIDHYLNEMTRYKEIISFKEFIQIKDPVNNVQYFKYKMQYLWYIFRIGLEF